MTMIVDLFGRIELNPTQADAISDRKRAILVQGGFGGGKSVCMQGSALTFGLDNPRSNVLVVRRTYDQIIDSVVADLEEKFMSPDPMNRLWPREVLYGGSWEMAYSTNDRRPTLKIINGTVYHFRGVIHDGREDPKKFGSVPFAGAFIEEFSELKDPTTFNYLDGRCRQKTTPLGYNRIMLVGNPPTQAHWSQYEFIELPRLNPAVEKVRSFYRLPTEENRQNLPAGYIENMRTTYSRSWIRRYLEGHAGIIEEGQPILKNVFAPETPQGAPWHVAEGELKPKAGYPIFRGWDFGVAYASCVWVQYIDDPYPQLLVLHELTHRQTSAFHFAPSVLVTSAVKFPDYEFIDIGDPSGITRSLADRRSPFEVLQEHYRIQVKKAVTNDIEKRKDAAIEAFSRITTGPRPFVQISNIPATEFLRDSLESGWAYPKDSTGYVARDQPIKNEWSHCADALGYITVSLNQELARFTGRKTEKRVSRQTTKKPHVSGWLSA